MALPNQPPPSRLQILEKGGRLVVIDRETGLPPLSAAERMRQFDAQAGNQPISYSHINEKVRGSSGAKKGTGDSSATRERINPFVAAQNQAQRGQRQGLAQKTAQKPHSRSIFHDIQQQLSRKADQPSLNQPSLNQREWVTLLAITAFVLVFLVQIFGTKFYIAAIPFSIYLFLKGLPQRAMRKLSLFIEGDQRR